MLGNVKGGIDDDFRQVLVGLLGGVVVHAGHVVALAEEIPLEVLQPEPVTGRREGAHEENPIGRAIARQSNQEHQPALPLQLHLHLDSEISMDN